MAVEFGFSQKSNFLNVDLSFVKNANEVELGENGSILLIGKSKDLQHIQVEHVKQVLAGLKLSSEWFQESIRHLSPSNETASPSVNWLNKLVVHTISSKCSRTNTPSRAHLINKIIKQNSFGDKQLILVVCEKKNSIASACAVSRSFPLFSEKTSNNNNNNKKRNVYASFIFVDDIKNNPQSIFPNEDDVKCYNTLSKSVRLTAKIVDSPCAQMNTDIFLDEVKKVAQELELEPLVIEGEDLDKQGFGGIYNVGKAAINKPKLVVLSSIKPEATKTIAWVGKGIVYDTGGLSIKPTLSMCGMKIDCGGAAGILGAFYTAVKLGFKDNLHAVFCLAENAVGPNSYRNDDIIRLYSGKTVEINNTDAEGRLVLGDGVAYAKKDLKADIIIDMATLTSAQGVATGKHHAAILTNNEAWERAAIEVSKNCGDLVYPIIFAPELHFSEFDSEVADMKNSVKHRDNALSSCAGLFVHSHLGSDFNGIWLHIDMASTVFESERATGYGVALLSSLFARSIENSTFHLVATTHNELPIKNEVDE